MIASALEVDVDAVLERAGHRIPQSEAPRPSVSVQQRNLEAECERWIAVYTADNRPDGPLTPERATGSSTDKDW